jgi:hypothetical protein
MRVPCIPIPVGKVVSPSLPRCSGSPRYEIRVRVLSQMNMKNSDELTRYTIRGEIMS